MRFFACGLAAIFTLLYPCLTTAEEVAVPRVLLVGDSWPGFMQAFKSIDVALDGVPGYEDYVALGARTAIMGAKAWMYAGPEYLQKVADELAAHPTIDIVHLSLGGNDMLFGSESYGGQRWRPWMSEAEAQAFFDAVVGDIETVIDFILAQRPDVRVALVGYTFADRPVSGATKQQVNEAFVQMERTKRDMALSKDRVTYVHNFGLMQYTYGIPEAQPPVPPMSVPYPGGYPDYTPFPGGLVSENAPLIALIDGDIHLTEEGYVILSQRCIDEVYGLWLDYPRVLEMVLTTSQGPVAEFSVTFMEAVAGVDSDDFAATLVSRGSLRAATVTQVTGGGAQYTVSVNLDGESGQVHLALLDDDSIVDGSGNPLGGPGAGNGASDFNGAFMYTPTPPLAYDDFDGALRSMDSAVSPYLYMLENEGGGISFLPEYADANGNIDIVNYELEGNGMLDAFEFGLIAACLQNPGLDLTGRGGVSHAMVAAAWEHNFSLMTADLGGAEGLSLIMIPGLNTVLGGFMTLGNDQSTSIPVLLLIALAAVDEFPVNVTVPNIALYTRLPDYFGPDGDADADGYTNREEYALFAAEGKEAYVTAALDPEVPLPDCTNTTGGLFEVGDDFCLAVPGRAAATTSGSKTGCRCRMRTASSARTVAYSTFGICR